MQYFPPALENLVEQFAKLPGVGVNRPSGWPSTCCPCLRMRQLPLPRPS